MMMYVMNKQFWMTDEQNRTTNGLMKNVIYMNIYENSMTELYNQ